jgi:hypothetical protein
MKSKNRNTWGFALAAAALLVLAPSRAAAGDPEFHDVVDRLAAQFQKRPMRFMGLLNFAANRFTPSGVSHLKMAIFDDVDGSLRPEAADFDAFMERVMGNEYAPFVRVRSNRDDEWTYIYMHPAGNQCEMFMVSLERHDAVVMKMRLNPDAFQDWMDEPVRHAHRPAHNGGAGASR